MSDFILYNYFRSSTSYRVRIALNLKKISYEYKAIHLLNNGGEQNKEEYRAINPIGGVPALSHKGSIISQSVAIIEYLDEIVPQPNLYPKDPYQKALVRQICENINCDIHPVNNLKVLQYLEKNFGADEDNRTKWIQHWVDQGFSATEKILRKTAGEFAFGDTITAADLFIIPQVFSAQRFQVNIEKYPIINLLNKKCLELEAFKLAHPLRQIDTPPELRIK